MPATAVLCSVLRDEAENVATMLRSWEGLYQYHVIGIDTHSSDDTEAIVRRWMRGREGIIYPYVWQHDFAQARNTYLDLALDRYPDAAYLILGDGDDVLDPRSREIVQAWLAEPNPQFLAVNAYVYLDEDTWGCPFIFYPRPTILRNRADVRFRFASHNIIDVPSDQQLLVQQLIVHHRQQPRKRAYREQQRATMNMVNLTRQTEVDPTDARALFYRANTALDCGQYLQAEEDYRRYLERSTWADERYQAWIHLAALRFQAQDLAGAEQCLWAALREPGQWNRAEAYMHLSDCALAAGRLGEALHWCSIAGEMPPPITSLFLQGAIYTYLPHWRLALLFDRLGHLRKAFAHAQRAAAWRPSPDILAAVAVLEQQLQAGPSLDPEGDGALLASPELPMATMVRPLPEPELQRMLAEIPVPSEDD